MALLLVTRTLVAPRRHLVLLGILAEYCHFYISVTHSRNNFTSVTYGQNMTTEFIPTVLLTDIINRTCIMTTKFIPVSVKDGEGVTDILTN